MCGIIGFIEDKKNVLPSIINGLKTLEYRGYDSAGVAFFRENNFQVIKSKGQIIELEKKIKKAPKIYTTCGIGHTRWATHGEPKDVNSHPHEGGLEVANFAIVHNGIIENYEEITKFLKSKKYKFKSQTDTESVAHLLDFTYRSNPKWSIQEIVSEVLKRIKGTFALAIIERKHPERIVVTRRDSPLMIGLGTSSNMIASDLSALIDHTKNYLTLDDDEVAIVEAKKVFVYDKNNKLVEKPTNKITWNITKAQKSGFPHYMLKEIAEEPEIIKKLISVYVKNKKIELNFSTSLINKLKNAETISIVGCGSAFYAGMIGQNLLEKLARLKTNIYISSEFRYQNPILKKNDICLLISQSGETADTIAALRDMKSRGIYTIAIVNVVASTIAREADLVLYTHAGPEIAVATTKAYLAQISLLVLFSLYVADLKKQISFSVMKKMIDDFLKLPKLLEKIVANKKAIQNLASKFALEKNVFFIGRGLDYAACVEGSLKLKEISYIHSEAYPAGELKHGSISLIEKNTLVVAIATQPNIYEKTISNINEVIARGAKVLLLKSNSLSSSKIKTHYSIDIPEIDPNLTPILLATDLQLLAYFVAAHKKCDIDKPRNLAKSVTVE